MVNSLELHKGRESENVYVCEWVSEWVVAESRKPQDEYCRRKLLLSTR